MINATLHYGSARKESNMAERPLCHPRKRFASIESAEAAVQAIYRRDRVTLTAKRCKLCGGFHLN
jgi:hypothetical protein